MPLVRIDLMKGKPEGFGKQVGAVVYRARMAHSVSRRPSLHCQGGFAVGARSVVSRDDLAVQYLIHRNHVDQSEAAVQN